MINIVWNITQNWAYSSSNSPHELQKAEIEGSALAMIHKGEATKIKARKS